MERKEKKKTDKTSVHRDVEETRREIQIVHGVAIPMRMILPASIDTSSASPHSSHKTMDEMVEHRFNIFQVKESQQICSKLELVRRKSKKKLWDTERDGCQLLDP